jgi:spore germination protein GerM
MSRSRFEKAASAPARRRAGALALTLLFLLAGCSRSSSLPEPGIEKVQTETTAISVFYPTSKILIEERRVVPVQENMPLVALRELFKAEPQEHKIVVVVPSAKVRSVSVDRKTGVATVDFTREILDFPEADRKAKLVAFAAIVETLKQFDEIKGFKILVEGKDRGTVAGKDIESFWGEISLKKQPFPIVRSPEAAETAQ